MRTNGPLMAGGRITIDLWRQSHAAEEVAKSWIGTEWIKQRIRFHAVEPTIDADHLSMLVSLLEPVEGAVLFPQDRVEVSQISGYEGLLRRLKILTFLSNL